MKYGQLIFHSLFWRIFSSLTTLGLTFIVARLLGPHISAQLNLFIAGATLLVLILNYNVDSSIIYFSANERVSLAELMSLVFVYSGASLLAVFCFFSAYPILPFKELGEKEILLGSCLYAIGLQVSGFAAAFYYGRREFRIPGFVTSLFNLLQILFLFYLYSSKDFHNEYLLNKFLPLFFAAPLIQGILLTTHFSIRYAKGFSFSFPKRTDLNRIFSFSSVFFLTNLLWFLMYRIDYWMLDYLDQSADKLADIGNYIQASKIGQGYLFFSSAIGSVVFSNVSASPDNIQANGLTRMIRLLLLGGSVTYLLILLVGQPVILFFYGPQFENIYPCCLLLIPGMIGLMAVSVTANYLSGIGKIKLNLAGVIIALSFIIVGNFFFIPIWGIFASALVSSIGYILYSVYMAVHFCKQLDCKAKDILLPKKDDWSFIKRLIARSGRLKVIL
jgi:O-antigen/teichoic acid export membrane protein